MHELKKQPFVVSGKMRRECSVFFVLFSALPLLFAVTLLSRSMFAADRSAGELANPRNRREREPESTLINAQVRKLKAFRKSPLPIFSRDPKDAFVRIATDLSTGRVRAEWGTNTLAYFDFLGWCESCGIVLPGLGDEYVFVNVGSAPLQFDGLTLQIGEYAALRGDRFQKIDESDLRSDSSKAAASENDRPNPLKGAKSDLETAPHLKQNDGAQSLKSSGSYSSMIPRAGGRSKPIERTALRDHSEAVGKSSAEESYFDAEKQLFDFQRENAAKGNAQSQCAMGIRYLNGYGVRQNTERGIDYLKKSAAQGEVRAKKILSELR